MVGIKVIGKSLDDKDVVGSLLLCVISRRKKVYYILTPDERVVKCKSCIEDKPNIINREDCKC